MSRRKIKQNQFSLAHVKEPYVILLIILFIEFKYAYLIPKDVLVGIPVLFGLVDVFDFILPEITKITHESVKYLEAVRCYTFLTTVFLPIKIPLFYSILNDERLGFYRFLVISPMTAETPAKGQNFINEYARKQKGIPIKNVSRSMESRVILSSLILLFTLAMCFMISMFNVQELYGSKEPDQAMYQMVNSLDLFLIWAIRQVTFTSFLVAISLCILRDYWLFISSKKIRDSSLSSEHNTTNEKQIKSINDALIKDLDSAMDLLMGTTTSDDLIEKSTFIFSELDNKYKSDNLAKVTIKTYKDLLAEEIKRRAGNETS